MSQRNKQLLAIMSGLSDSSIRFSELCSILDSLGFSCRIKGDHHIFYMTGIDEIINIQPLGSKAKAYQVKQIRNIILRYKLGGYFDA